MFSKWNFSVMAILPAVLLSLSCTPKVGEAPPVVQEKKLDSLQCVSNLRTVFKDFVKAEASDEQVASMWECSQNAIKSFKQYVYGRTDDRFHPEEIAKFLQDDFLDKDGPPISIELQKQVMHFKRLFIGGSGDYVTRAELDSVVNVLERFKNLSVKLNPSMPVLVKRWQPAAFHSKPSLQIEVFEKASTDAEAAFEEIADMIADNNQAYELDNFASFLKEVALFTQSESDVSAAVIQYLPVVKKLKKTVAGGDEQVVTSQEWRNFTGIGAKSYLQYLRYYYFVESLPESKTSNDDTAVLTDYMMRSLQDLSQSFEFWISRKPADPACLVPGSIPANNAAQSSKSASKSDVKTGSKARAEAGSKTTSKTNSETTSSSLVQEGTSCISQAEISEVSVALAKANSSFQHSDKLIAEIMKLKAVLFGGSVENFTAADFQRGGAKFEALHASLGKAFPFLNVYTAKWDPSAVSRAEALSHFYKAKEVLNVTAQEVGVLFEGSYDIESLKILLSEWNRLYGKDKGSKETTLMVTLSKFMPLLRDVKNAVFSDGDTVIRKAQWAPFLNLSAQGYTSFLYYNYFVANTEAGTSAFLEGFKALSDQANRLLSDVLAVNKNHLISRSQLRQIVQRLAELEMMPQGISKSSLEMLVDVVVERVLWPAEARLKGNAAPGLTEQSLRNIRGELQVWYETEQYFYQLGRRQLDHRVLKSEIAKKYEDKSISSHLKIGLGESGLLLAGFVPKVVDGKRRLIISGSKRVTYDVASLSQLNLHRAMGRIVIRSAIDSSSRLSKNEGLTLEEAQAFFARVRPALDDLALLDRKNLTFIENRFRESNVFSPHSNGDTLSNFEEVSDIVGLVYSGSIINAAFKKNLIATCGVKPRPGVDVSVSEECVYRVYFRHTTEHMSSMPEYIKIFNGWSESEWQTYFSHILKAAGHVPNENGTITFSTLSLAPHVTQYMEMLYSRFDHDYNELIDTQEALNAFPSFSGLLAELTKDEPLIKQKDLPALFTYILNYGAPPGGVKDFFFRWLPWKGNQSSWRVAADRQKVAQIFSFIAEKARSSSKSKVMVDEEIKMIQQDPRFQTLQ